MKKTIRKKYFPRKLFTLALLSLIFSFSFFPTPKAQAWLAPAAAVLNANIKIMHDTVKGVMLGSLKQQAMQALNREVSLMVGGSSSGNAMFVVDWKNYLIDEPEKKTRLYMNARIDDALSGRGSLSQYIPAGSEGFGLSGGNYLNSLKVGIQNTIINPSVPKVTYVGEPSQMFVQGNFHNASLYLSGINNPFAFNLYMQQEQDKINQENQLIAQKKVEAGQGFIGKESNGKTITPGILIKEQLAGVQNMGFQIAANATNLPEIFTAVISRTAIESALKGVGNVQANINKEITSAQNQASNQINSAISQYGPGAQYTQNWAPGATPSR